MKLQNRKQFEIFDVNDGYEIDTVIGTTYTYNQRMLPEILLRIYCGNHSIMIDNLSENQKRMLLKKANDSRINLFIFKDKKEKHSILSSSKESMPIDKFIIGIEDNYVFEVEQEKGIFHPKIILLRLIKDNSVKYGLLVSSKNLVVDSFYQNGVQFEGILNENTGETTQNGEEISKFLSKIDLDKRIKKDILEELRHVNFFSSDDRVKNSYILFGDHKENLEEKVRNYIKNKGIFQSNKFMITVLTDSLGKEFVEHLCKEKNGGNIVNFKIITNPIRWGKQDNYPDYAYVPQKGENVYREYIHAKNFIVYTEEDEEAVVIIGSANATKEAFHNNCEAIAVFTYRKEQIMKDGEFICSGFPMEKMTPKIFDEYAEEVKRKELGDLLDDFSMQSVELDESGKAVKIEIMYNGTISNWQEILGNNMCYLSVELFGGLGSDRILPDHISDHSSHLFTINTNSILALYKKKIILTLEYGSIKVQKTLNIEKMDKNLQDKIDEKIRKQKEKPDKYFYDRMISLGDLIPNTPYFDQRDTADEKLAKYISFGGSVSDVINSIEDILKTLKDNYYEKEEPEEPEEDSLFDKDEVEYMKHIMSKYYKMLTGNEYEEK